MNFALLTSAVLVTSFVAAAPTNDTHVVLPPGTSNHGNPNLVCFPAKWTDIAVFFLGNYVAHAATIVLEPGAPALITIQTVAMALFFPVSGVNKGFQAIFSFAKFASTDLQTAARAGALCKVVRTKEYARTNREARLTIAR